MYIYETHTWSPKKMHFRDTKSQSMFIVSRITFYRFIAISRRTISDSKFKYSSILNVIPAPCVCLKINNGMN